MLSSNAVRELKTLGNRVATHTYTETDRQTDPHPHAHALGICEYETAASENPTSALSVRDTK